MSAGAGEVVVVVVADVVVVREVEEPPTVITLVDPLDLVVEQSGPLVDTGPRGPPGPPGPQGATGATGSTGEADEAVCAGQPVYVKANGHVGVAHPDAMPQAGYAGIALADAAVGFIVTYGVGVVTLPDWTSVVGSAALIPGAVYYLGLGSLTPDAPSIGYCVVVGRALTTTTMHAYQELSILL